MNHDTEGYETNYTTETEKQKILNLFVELGAEIFLLPGGIKGFLQKNPFFNQDFIQVIEKTQSDPGSINALTRFSVPKHLTTESLKASFNKHLDTAKECLGEVNNNAGEDNHE